MSAIKPKDVSAELLSLMPVDVNACLQGLCVSLSRLVGQIKTAPLCGKEVPEGFAGLTRKVNYQRLLMSEWGLLQHLPTEFMRRAAMGEHLFLDQQRSTHHKAANVLVLFNTGPEQLGSIRVVHLAVWLLMVRRCEAAKAQLHWGILQESSEKLSTRSDPHVMTTLLSSRSACYLSQEHLENWRPIIENGDWSECWVIGAVEGAEEGVIDDAVGLKTTFAKVNSVSIQEPWTTTVDSLDIDVVYQGQRRSMSLTLPDAKLLLRMLRNPFETPKAIELQSSDDAFVFAGVGGHGRRAIYKDLAKNRIKILPLPGSANAKAGKPKYFSWDEKQDLLAINVIKKRLSVITYDHDYWYLHRFSGNSSVKVFAKSQRIQIHRDTDLIPFFQFTHSRAGKKVIRLVDADDQLRELDWCENAPLWKTPCSDVLFHGQAGNVNFFIHWLKDDNEVEVIWGQGNSQSFSKRLPVQITRKPKAMGHASGTWFGSNNGMGLVAIEYDVNLWRLYGRSDYENVDPIDTVVDQGYAVIGIITLAEQPKPEKTQSNVKHLPYLVLLDKECNTEGCKQVILKSGEHERVVYTSHVKIVSAHQCVSQPSLHIVTEAREHIVFSFTHDEIIMRQSLGDL